MPHPGVIAQDCPNRPAFVMGGSGEVVTFRQLDERSNRGAQLFRSLGLQTGDHICFMMGNNRQFLEIVWAAQRSGLVFTPISPHIDKGQALHIIGNCNARLFIGARESADIADAILREPQGVDHFFMINGAREGFLSWEDACAGQPATRITDESNGVPMLYSSGTSGLPKGIATGPAGLDVNTPPLVTLCLASVFEFNAETVYLCPAPLYHAAPLHFTMMATYQGGTVVVMEKFEPEQALKLIERHRVTHGQFVPYMFTQMLKLPAVLRMSYDMTSLRIAIHGAQPCPTEVKMQMIDWWGETLVEYYSSSEAIGMTLIGSSDWLERPGSVGRALVGTVHIVDDNGRELPPGETGTIYFSGDHVRFNYYNDAPGTSQAYNDSGWATTRDIGYLDEDGYLYLADCARFTIVSGGITIYPQELEGILATHDKVAAVSVYGVPSQKYGEEVKAVIRPITSSEANEETADEILRWLSDRVAWFKMPRSLDFDLGLTRPAIGNPPHWNAPDDQQAGAQ